MKEEDVDKKNLKWKVKNNNLK